MKQSSFSTLRRMSLLSLAAAAAVSSSPAWGQTPGEAAKAYAETMLASGRDRYGKPTPLFVTNLSRTPEPYLVNEGNIANVSKKPLPGWTNRYYDRAWGGANLADHIQLHELLDALTQATGDPKYRQASDEAIAFTFKQTRSEKTHFPMWGEHLSWDVRNDRVYSGQKPAGTPHSDTHELKDRLSPRFWARLYELAPQESFDFAKALWDHQIFDKSTGQFSRHAKFTEHGPDKYAASFPRVGGWMIHAWAEAYKRSEDAAYREEMLTAVTTLTSLYERNCNPVTGAISAGTNTAGDTNVARDFSRMYWLENTLLFAIELERAIPNLPPELGQRLRALQAGVDEVALTKLEHNLDGHLADMPHGFLERARADLPLVDGKMQIGEMEKPYSTDWSYGYGSALTSDVARQMAERYRATKDPRYMALITQAADRYLTMEPPRENTAPFAVGEVINLMLDMHEFTGSAKYVERATHYGKLAQEMFLDGSPLPRATASLNHYEAITGGDDLMLALWRLSQVSAPKP